MIKWKDKNLPLTKGSIPKPTSALFRVDEPESKVEFPKRKWSSRNESRVPETKVRVPETKVEFPKRSSRNQSRSSRNETGGPETKKGLGNNRHGQKINNDLHEFTCACGDLFLMHDSSWDGLSTDWQVDSLSPLAFDGSGW